jgi:alkylation response protein AidB-like acyl-CoA dehydrogenase
VNFSLTALEQDLVDRARKLAAEFVERAPYYDEMAAFPKENFDRLREEGFLKLTVPQEYGGFGLWSGDRYLAFYLILEALAAGCSSTGQLLQLHSHCTGNIAALANEEQKRRILGDVVHHGALIGSAGDASMAIASGEAILRPTDGGFRLTSHTRFGSLSAAADYLFVFAAAPSTESFSEGCVILCIPRDTPGVTVEDNWSNAMGMRATVSWSVSLDDVFVPWTNVIGKPGDFIQRDPRGWTLAYAANYLGTAQGTFDFVIRYLEGKSYLLKDDVVSFTVAEMDAALQATRASLWYASWLWEQQEYDAAELASLRVIHSAKETALMVTEKAFEVCGARSGFRDLPLERAWRNVRFYTLHTRETRYTRLLTSAVVTGDFHAKQYFGPKTGRLSWESFGVTPPPMVTEAGVTAGRGDG